MAGGIGSAISGDVVRQLEVRKNVIGKTSNKTREDLLYTTSKTGWIKLSSSVNTLTDEEVFKLRKQQGRGKINGSSKLANFNILMGGLLDPNRDLRAGIDTTGRYNTGAAYNTDLNTTGLRPMPGITSMTVKSKNTYGTLREAEVKFVCWTLDDFERMDKLYLRPGFSMLLEWGHSLYLDGSGKLQNTIETVPNEFFTKGVNMSSVLNTIRNLRHKSNYNYEGMIGYVKNFSWNYTSNGGYECTVTVISTGEILESLQIKFDPKQRIPVKEMEDADSSEGKEQKKSIYHYFIQKLQKVTDSATFTKLDVAKEAKTFAEPLEDFTGYYYEAQLDDHWMYDQSIDLHWVSLRTIFDIFNKHITIVDLSKAPGSPDYGYVTINTDYFDQTTGEYLSSKYITSPEHFSIDPLVCVLPKTATISTVGVNWLASAATLGSPIPILIPSSDPQVIKVDAVHDNLAPLPNASSPDDVLNILVSMPFLKAKLDEALDVDGKRNKSVFDIFKSMLEGINTALGGINDLDLTFDEDQNRYYLIDRNATPGSSPYHPTLTMAGVDSIFTEVSISSKISNEMASQVSVAAQGSTMNYSDNVDNILKWNPNIIDRMRVTKDTSTKPSPETEEAAEARQDEAERIDDWKNDVVDFFDLFNGGAFKAIFNEGFDKSDLEAAKTLHAEWTANNVAIKYREANNESVPGLIPVELSFKTDGIGGLKIGEAFKIRGGILPAEYQNKFGYIITGLEHTIDDKGRWETSVTTQFYLLGNGGSITGYAGATGDPGARLREVNQRLLDAENAGVRSSTKGGTIRTIEGVTYKNGQIPQDKLRYINNWKNYVGSISSDDSRIRLYPKASRALDQLLAAAEAAGIKFKINGAYRTVPDQVNIKARYGSNAAEPGTSNHGFGLAVDFSTPGDLAQLRTSTKQYKWLKENASKYGFRRLGFAGKPAGENWEAWHWEYQI